MVWFKAEPNIIIRRLAADFAHSLGLLPGDSGSGGSSGAPGAQGAQGATGSMLTGVAGASGAAGVAGPAGEQGEQGATGALTPAQYVAAVNAAVTTRTILGFFLPDLGVAETTTSGRAATWANQLGTMPNWIAPTTIAEPAFNTSDPNYGGRASLTGNGTNRYMTNAYNPPAPGTVGWYNLSVRRLETWVSTKTFSQAATNRFGCRLGPKSCTAELLNPTIGAAVDFYERRTCITEELFTNSTADKLTVGPTQNTATGINTGNTDPSSLGLFATNAGASLVSGSCGSLLYTNGPLSTGEINTLRALAVQYYGPSIDQTRKIARVLTAGDSITRNANATDDNGWRYYIYQAALAANYTIDFIGTTTAGTFPDNQHMGISGYTIADLTTLLAANIGPTKQFNGWPALVMLLIGTNDVSGGTYAPGTTVAAYRALLDQVQAAEPQTRISVSTIPPQSGNPAGVAAFNAELIAEWDSFDLANPTRTLLRWDAHAALGGTYTPALMADAVHPNDAGHIALGTAAWAVIAPYLNTATTW